MKKWILVLSSVLSSSALAAIDYSHCKDYINDNPLLSSAMSIDEKGEVKINTANGLVTKSGSKNGVDYIEYKAASWDKKGEPKSVKREIYVRRKDGKLSSIKIAFGEDVQDMVDRNKLMTSKTGKVFMSRVAKSQEINFDIRNDNCIPAEMSAEMLIDPKSKNSKTDKVIGMNIDFCKEMDDIKKVWPGANQCSGFINALGAIAMKYGEKYKEKGTPFSGFEEGKKAIMAFSSFDLVRFSLAACESPASPVPGTGGSIQRTLDDDKVWASKLPAGGAIVGGSTGGAFGVDSVTPAK